MSGIAYASPQEITDGAAVHRRVAWEFRSEFRLRSKPCGTEFRTESCIEFCAELCPELPVLLLKFRPLLSVPALKFCSERVLCSRFCASDPPPPLKIHAAASAKVKFRARLGFKSAVQLRIWHRQDRMRPPRIWLATTGLKFGSRQLDRKFYSRRSGRRFCLR